MGRLIAILAVLSGLAVLPYPGLEVGRHLAGEAWAAPAAADPGHADPQPEGDPQPEADPDGAPAPEVAPAPSHGGPEGWQASFQATGQPSLRGFLDSPSPGQSFPHGAPIVVAGWVANLDDPQPPGVLEIHVYDGLLEGGAMLGQAQLGLPKPDVAQFLSDERFATTGFRLEVAPARLPAGQHVLSVYARTRENGWWVRSVSVQVQAPPAAAAPPTTPGGGPRPTPPPLTTNTSPRVEDHQLTRALDDAGSWRSNTRETVARYQTKLYFSSEMPEEALAVYLPGLNEVRVHPGFKEVRDRTVLTTVLVHEITHLIDFVRDPDRFLSAEGCYATEVNAFEVEMTYWKEAHGLQGKRLTLELLQTDFWGFVFADYFNASLRAFLGSRSEYEQRLRQVYVPQCAWRG